MSTPGKKVFVGNLAYETTEEELKEAFEKAGTVVDSKIVRRGNRSKGFGFVEFSTEDEAEKAVELLDKQNLNDRPINVQVSTSSGTKVGNDNTERFDGGGYNRDNYRDNYRENYRDNNYRDNNYRDNNYRDNNYRDNNYRENYRSYDNRGPRRNMGLRGRGNFNNNNGNGQRRVYFLKDRYYDNGSNRNNNNRPPRRNNNYRSRNNDNNNRSQSNVEKVESQTTIFVANLPFDVDDEQLITLFEKCGAIKTAHVVKNRGRSKGYGFVEFEDNDGQKKALADMDNFQIVYRNGEERNLSVKVAMSTGDNEEDENNENDDDNEKENENNDE